MRVNDIYADVKSWSGLTDQTTIFSLISDAHQMLSNKGGWEPRKVYLDLPVQSSNLVTLPSFVETPLKVNVGDLPSFSRDRVYEFSINGPGSGTQRVDFAWTSGTGWEDRAFVPTLVTLPTPSRLLIAGDSAPGDVGLKVVVEGFDVNNAIIKETLVIAATDVASVNTFYAIREVNKDQTTNSIQLWASVDGVAHTTLLSTYLSYETECKYRQIRLSKSGVTAHCLVLKKNNRVYSLDDFIPIVSTVGMRLMIKALIFYQRTDSDLANKFEQDAVRIATDAQKSLTSFIDLAKETEMDTARGLNYNNRDSIIVADIYDDVAKVVGPIGRAKIFDKITEGLEALNNKGHWDGLTGFVDILTSGGHFLVLPRYVESPIAINVGGRPMFFRNKWFEFHLNGPGSDQDVTVNSWDWVGDVVVQNPLTFIVQLTIVPDNPADDGKTVTIYGLDQNSKPLMTGSTPGITYTVDHTKQLPLPGDQQISEISRITRDATTGFVRMMGFSTDLTQSVQLGYWYPDETEPQYMRIDVPTWSNWVRMRYRKRTLRVTSLTDPLHLKNKLAINCMVRSIEERYNGNKDAADDFEVSAIKYISEEQMSRNPSEHFDMQWDEVSFQSNLILI